MYLGPPSSMPSVAKIMFSPAGSGLGISKVTVFLMYRCTQSHIFAQTTNNRKHFVIDIVDIMLGTHAAVAFAR